MDDTENALARAQKRVETANNARARAEFEREAAARTLAETKAALKDEFGIVTGADMKRVEAELQTELDALVAQIEKDLEEAGA